MRRVEDWTEAWTSLIGQPPDDVRLILRGYGVSEKPKSIDFGADICWTFVRAGFQLCYAVGGTVEMLDFSGEGRKDADGMHPFSGTLPFGLEFHFSQTQVRSALGPPTRTNPKAVDLLLGEMPEVDIFQIDRFRVCVHYSDELERFVVLTVAAWPSE